MNEQAPDPNASLSLRDTGRLAMRRELLTEARALLRAEGPQALSTRRLAQRVGASTTVIYALFGGKPGLAEALYAAAFERLGAHLRAVPAHPDPLGHVRTLVRVYRREALASPAEYALMFGQLMPEFTPSPAAKARALESLEPLVRAVGRTVPDGAEATHLALRLWAATHGVVTLELSGHLPAGEAQAMLERTADDLLGGGRP